MAAAELALHDKRMTFFVQRQLLMDTTSALDLRPVLQFNPDRSLEKWVSIDVTNVFPEKINGCLGYLEISKQRIRLSWHNSPENGLETIGSGKNSILNVAKTELVARKFAITGQQGDFPRFKDGQYEVLICVQGITESNKTVRACFTGYIDYRGSNQINISGNQIVNDPSSNYSEDAISGILSSDKKFKISTYRKILEREFGKEDIKTICQDMEIVYENLGSEDTLSGRTRELIRYCQHHGRLLQLLITTAKARPHSSWDELWN